MRPDTLDSLDTMRIPLVNADGTLDFYAKPQFPSRITDLVQEALVAAFEASGRNAEVTTKQDALHVDYELLTDIEDFQAQYDQPDGIPTAKITLSVKLVAVRGRRIVGNFTTHQSAPASANSVGAATQAFQSALIAAADAVVGWALASPAPKP